VTTTLGFALLGLLAQRPHTGYALASRMREPVGYFWTAVHSQIYPELSRLESDDLVTHTVIDGPGPRPTKEYALTAAGRAALRDWIESPVKPPPARDEFMLRVFCLGLVDRESARHLVERERERHVERLTEYERHEIEFGSPPPRAGATTFGAYATLRAGLSYERHLIDYCDWLLAELD
jgi:DNA-binding PadR family transcriptional regulator